MQKSIRQKSPNLFKPLLFILLPGLLLASCTKDKTITQEKKVHVEDKTITPKPKEPKEPTRAKGMVPYYKLQRVENLPAETNDKDPTAPKVEILFSLDYKKVQPNSYAKTSLWDLSFSNLYNASLGGNSGTNSKNFGYQGPGKGGITIVDKPFDKVTEIPPASKFKTGDGVLSTDDAGEFGQGVGWYLYDFGGLTVGDGSEEKKHVAYALGDTIKTNKGENIVRTVIVRLASGDFAKIKMISVYKDAFTADKMLRKVPHMFFTFEYVIVPANAKKFEVQ